MYQLNKKLEYAIIALKHLYALHPGELATAKEISEDYKIPFDTTSRVMQIMTQHDVLRSEHGVRGGYCIQKNLSQVSLYELMELILGPVEIANCINSGHADCDCTMTCNIIPAAIYLNDRVQSLYREITLQDLISVENDDGAEKVRQDFQKRHNPRGNHADHKMAPESRGM